jgi:DNA-binding response OmpR family regulator
MSSASDERKPGKMILVGFDHSQILERRFKAAGYDVLTVRDCMAAIDHARREPWDAAVLVSTGSLVNVADTAFNLRDLNRSMEIIILVNRLGPRSNRFLRPLLEHPIERTRVLTRRQLQRELTAFLARQQRSATR